ncbi:hypothetical protein P3G55_17220, partial [Leptospira sp. 96542]|nr:hypothetical protein [Leptospira sp. 96542]
EILNVILHSFPMDPNQKTYPNQSVPVKKLGFTFQERKVPISIEVLETEMTLDSLNEPEISDYISLFRFLT